MIIGNEFSIRDKAILTGLYLSKFDEDGLTALGFEGFTQAFNVLGYSLGTKPASIKNYRDEFDPYFPNPRKGWHKRIIREYCREFLNDFSSLNLGPFTDLIKSFVIRDYDIEKLIERIEEKDKSESVARRLVTGRAAEEYFKSNYHTVDNFLNFDLKDATALACGFDFKLSLHSEYYCVEVKGLNSNFGSISLTEKEFSVANEMRKRYCLFIVRNFVETPNHQLFFDPLHSSLSFKRIERRVTQINYATSIV